MRQPPDARTIGLENQGRVRESRQVSRRMSGVIVLMGYAEDDPAVQSYLAAFQVALAKLGWTEGSNLRIELRWGASDPDRIRTFAKELVELRPDAIIGVTTVVVRALARETSTIPIVFATVIDPIGNGFAGSHAHPGGNITGFTVLDAAIGGKWVELLKEIAPLRQLWEVLGGCCEKELIASAIRSSES